MRAVDFVILVSGRADLVRERLGMSTWYRGLALIVSSLVIASCGEVTVASADDLLSDVIDAIGGDVASDAAASDVQGGECITDFDCVGKVLGMTPCLIPACTNGICGKSQRESGSVCQKPGETLGECEQSTCDSAGQCAVDKRPDGEACGGVICGKV